MEQQLVALFKRSRIIAAAVALFATVPVLQILIAQWLVWAPQSRSLSLRQEDILNERYPVLVAAAVTLPLFFSLVRSATISDGLLRERFHAESPAGFLASLRFLLRSSVFWAQCGGYALLYWMFPLRWCFPSWVTLFPAAAESGLLTVILLPALFLLNLLARLSAMRVWRREKPPLALWFRLPILVVDYGVGSLLLIGVLPVLRSIASLLRGVPVIKILLAVAILLLLPPAYRRARAFWKRWQFCRKLNALRRRGVDISEVRFAYRSLLAPYKGESFHLRIDGKEYACKLISALHRKTPLSLGTDGTGAFHIRPLSLELFSYKKSFSFDFDAEGTKLLIFNPVPRNLLIYQGEKAFPLDSGDTIVCNGSSPYKLFSASAFFSALERNVLDR